MPEARIKEKGEVNKHCKIKKRQRQYLTSTFQYKDMYVGLLELENYPSSAAATWVIISKENSISKHIFNSFISFFLEDNLSTKELKAIYNKSPIKFITKNHERDETLTVEQLTKWLASLVGKLSIN